MRVIVAIIFSCLTIGGYTQINHVISGGEVINYGIVDLSLNSRIDWSTERSSNPGYFSVFENGDFIGFSNAVHINGYVKKFGNARFVFPVGNGNALRALEISPPEKITDAYAVAWIEGDPSDSLDLTAPNGGRHSIRSVAAPITHVSAIGQWDWQVGEAENLGAGTTGNGNGLNITLTLPDMRSFAEASALRMVGWNGFRWVDLSGRPTATGNIEYSKITGTMIAGITAIGIGKVADENMNRIGLLLYPNPVINYHNINIRFVTPDTGEGELFVYDAAGKLVIRQSIQYNTGVNIIPIEVQHLASGTYFINLFGSGGTKIFTGKRFVKQ